MKLIKYGITLHMMKEEHIEMVREWRNSPSVVNNYEYREYITPEMQKEWFKGVYNNNNLYLVIEYMGEKIGVVNAKDIDYDKRSLESGIFIPDGKFSSTFIPAIVMILTMEIGFRLLSWRESYAHVLKTNKPVQGMIKAFGYELCPDQENVENQLYRIDREKFFKKAQKLLKAMDVVIGVDEPVRIITYRTELSDPVVKHWDAIARNSPVVARVEETPESTTYFLA